MRSALAVKSVALSVALVLHGALAVALVSQDRTQIAGAEGGTEVRLGSAFADMAAGTLSPVRPETAEVTAAETPAHLDAVRPEVTPPAKVAALPPEPAARAVVAERGAVAVVDAATVLTSDTGAERITAQDPQSTAVAQSLRPRPRNVDAVQRAEPVAEAKPKSVPPKTKPAPGNADRTAQAGAATGQRKAMAQHSGAGRSTPEAGTAAASNYPGLVMRTLSRAGKPRVTARGTAVIAFSIAANGGLSSVSLARSSGSAALDQAALQLVRGAGPFPRPPVGARRSFSIQIKGR